MLKPNKRKANKVIATMLTLVMLIAMIPANVFAINSANVSSKTSKANTGGISIEATGSDNQAKTAADASLEAAVNASTVATASVVSIKITAGQVTEADWKYLSKLTAMTTFEIDSAVTDVVNMPNIDAAVAPLFPKSIVNVTVPQPIAAGNYAFQSCKSLTKVSFPAVTAIGEFTFASCESLTESSFPAVTSIGSYAFQSCKSLTKVSFPAVTSIGLASFISCSSLVEASFPAVKTIDKAVFSGCKKLAALALPATPPTVGTDAFKGCPATRTLDFVDADGKDLTGDALKKAIADYKAVDDGNKTDNLWYGWNIPVHINTTIIANATSASGDTLEDAIKASKIPADKVTSLKITGGNVTEDDWYYIGNLPVLADFEIDKAVAKVADMPEIPAGEMAFFQNSIVSFKVPHPIKMTPTSFQYTNLASVSLLGVEEISFGSFNACANLTSASFPAAKSIGYRAFSDCTALTSIKLPAIPPTVGTGAFNGTPEDRKLIFVDANGNPLTGDAWKNAVEKYKADATDGDATDNLWYGWTITTTPPATPSTGGGSYTGGGTTTYTNHTPEVISGAKQSIVEKNNETASFRIDRPFVNFLYVEAGKTVLVEGTHYTVKEGSTIVTLLPAYTNTLSVGTHTVRVEFIDGYAVLEFEVKPKATIKPIAPTAPVVTPPASNNPQTGDSWFAGLFF